MPLPWSEQEVRLAVQDYFDMLLKEMRGEKYVKTDHNRRLASQLNARSKGSVEFKHENISAVLLEMELPYIDGYKPRKNVQGILRSVVAEYAEQYRDMLAKAADAECLPEPQVLGAVDWTSVLVTPPQYVQSADMTPTVSSAGPRKFDFAGRESRNRKLGKMGEEFAMQFETIRLEQLGRKDLAKRIEWVSQRDDTAGFDILSFGHDAKERFIEVKTTNCGRSFPFMISQGEVEFAESHAARYSLYRLFTFRVAPRLFMLDGDVRKHCHLEPRTFKASFGGAA